MEKPATTCGHRSRHPPDIPSRQGDPAPPPVDEKYLPTGQQRQSGVRGADASVAPVEQQPDSPAFDVDVRRSRRRTRTVSAYREGNTIVVLVPERLSRADERRWVDTMVARVTRAELRRRPDDQALQARAERLSARYLDGKASPASVRWVTNQHARWGSCTPLDRTIRLSARLQGMPSFVVDYVLLHELTHLLVPGHGKAFWEWVNRFESVERARGFLEGFAAASRSSDAAGTADGGPLSEADATPEDDVCTGEPKHAVG